MQAVISQSATATVINLVADKPIIIVAMHFIVAGAVIVTIKDTDDNVLIGPESFAGNGDGVVLNYNPLGHCQSAIGKGIKIHLSGAVQVGGSITYTYVHPKH